jgi:hypothetical protein
MAEQDWVAIVAEGTCDECGLRASAVPRAELPSALRDAASEWAELLSSHPSVTLRARPSSGWSPLEYAAHVRDVLAKFSDRVEVALMDDDPVFGWWDHEAAAVDQRYNDSHPALVGRALSENAARLADFAARVPDSAWMRSGTRRPGESFTIEGLVRFALHEVRHHLADARSRATR